MRIGIDCRLWNESGVGRYIRNLVCELQEIDHENEYVLFALSKDSDGVKLKVKSLKFKVATVDIRWHTIAEQLEFPRILNSYSLDLVHFPYFSVPIFYKRPFVVTIHDLILHHYPTGAASTLPSGLYRLKLLAYKYIIQHAAKNAQNILTVSEATKQEIIDHLFVADKKIHVTYEGVDKHFQTSLIRDSRISDPFFLHVGNLYPHKNMSVFLDALKVLIQRYDKPIKLVIVGKKDHFFLEFVKKVEQASLINHVILLGEISDSELAGLYKKAVGIVSSSVMEGFDLPVVEAMKLGCPIIVSDIPVHKELCGKAAVFFNPKDTEQITNALFDVLNEKDTETQKRIAIGKTFVEKLSWKLLAENTLAVYESSTRL